jgi:hypothetical protein
MRDNILYVLYSRTRTQLHRELEELYLLNSSTSMCRSVPIGPIGIDEQDR